MFEAYAIGVTLRLNNLISPQLALLAREFEGIDARVLGITSTLRKLGQESAALRQVAAAGNATDRSLDRASRSAERLERHLAAIRTTSGISPTIAPMLPLGGSGGSRGGGGGNHRTGAHGGNIHMGSGGIGVGTVGLAAGDAFVPIALSAGMIWAGHSLYESAKDLNTEMTRFKLFGMGDKLNNEAFKFVQGMHVYGTTQAENMKNFREAQGVFRESGLHDSEALAGAKLAAPILAKISFATQAMDEESKAKMRASSMSMLRWVEMSGGLKDAQTFNRLADFGWKMVQTSGGTVDWEQLRQFAATSGVAGRSITPDGLAALEPIIAEFKGGRAGTSLRTAFNRLNGIVKLPNQAAHELVEGGIWDASKVTWNANGGIKRFNGNPFTSAEEFQRDPVTWYEKYMLPMYEKLGKTPLQRNRDNAMLFGSTGGAMFSQIENSLATIHRSVDAQHKAFGIDESVNKSKESLSGQEVEFQAAWTDFKTQFGTLALPMFSGLLKSGSELLRTIGNFVNENPELVRFLGKVTALGISPATTLSGMIVDGTKSLFGNTVKPAASNGSSMPSSIQLVPTQGGRPLAEYTAKSLAKHQFGSLGSGVFDLNIAQPSVNLRTN